MTRMEFQRRGLRWGGLDEAAWVSISGFRRSARRPRRGRPNQDRNSGLEEAKPGYDEGMRIELITTGSELLLGQVLNSHPGYLSGRLAILGLELARQTAVPDGKEAIQEVLGEAWRRADLVIVTGGLGPTSDDITRDVVSEFFKRPLEYHGEIYDKVGDWRFEGKTAGGAPRRHQDRSYSQRE